MLTLCFIASAYFLVTSYYTLREKEQTLQGLKSQVNQTKQQIALYPEITDKDREQWQNIKEKFFETYPMSSLLPRRITYSAVDKSFQGIDIPVEAVSLYEMLYSIARKTQIPMIEILPLEGKEDPFKNETLDKLLSGQLIQFQFVVDYSNIFWFIREIRSLPLVLDVVSVNMERSEGLVQARIAVKFFNRKQKDPFPKI